MYDEFEDRDFVVIAVAQEDTDLAKHARMATRLKGGPRFEIAARARALLDPSGAPTPDLVVGDLNMTRGGAALAAFWPGYRHAFDEGGHGYGATFDRAWPIYHIDHVLLGEGVNCARYDIVDPGIARHRAQVAWITPST